MTKQGLQKLSKNNKNLDRHKTQSTGTVLDVKPRHSDINTYSLNQFEDDKHICKPIHDSQKQINTSRLIDINQTSERLK